MKLVAIHPDLINLFSVDPEMLVKERRPCVLIAKLLYKGKRHSFAIPLRSNISGTAPSGSYFALPPRSTTKPGNHHGLHYIKMFPVSKHFILRYRIEGDKYATMVKNIIDTHEKQIISECQNYLTAYESGNHPSFCTDIDKLVDLLETQDEKR